MVKNKWSNIQLYSKVNSVQSYEKRLIMVNVHEECYLIVFLHRLISVMCLKCPPSAQCLFLNRARHWTTNALIVLFTDCLCEVEAWMRASRLQLNPQKTQLIWLGSRQQLDKLNITDVQLLSTTLHPQSTVCSLGVILDSQLTMSSHIIACGHVCDNCPIARSCVLDTAD